ncbi:MAG: helix-turn-helix transcriptional regulator [Flavobacteriales bacterium]|nr:helix-turn-helix transcriptional regulator [Flavobacteriales bacterium]
MNKVSFEHLQNVLVRNNRVTEQSLAPEIFQTPLDCKYDDPLLGCGHIKSDIIRNEVILNITKTVFPSDTLIENHFLEPMVAMYFMVGGKASIEDMDGNEIEGELKKGECIFFIMPAGQVNFKMFKEVEDHHFVGVHFTFDSFRRFSKAYLDRLPSDILESLNDSTKFFNYRLRIDDEIKHSLEMLLIKRYKEETQLLYFESKITEFTLFFFRNLADISSDDQIDAIENVHLSLSNNFIVPPSIEEMSKQAGMSQSKFYQEFSVKFKITPYQFVKELKLNHAKTLLSERKMQVMDVAYLVGYDSPEGFSRAFKSKFKISPKDLNSN